MLSYGGYIVDPVTGHLYQIRIKRRTRYMHDPKRRAYFEKRFEEERKEREKHMCKDGYQVVRTMRFDEANMLKVLKFIMKDNPRIKYDEKINKNII